MPGGPPQRRCNRGVHYGVTTRAEFARPACRPALAFLTLAVLAAVPASADIVYQNNFAGGANGFSGTVDTTGPGGSAAIHVSDTSTGSSASSVLAFSNAAVGTFDTAQPSQATLLIDFDYAITACPTTPPTATRSPGSGSRARAPTAWAT
jgi:hypothetical protein